MSILAVVGCFGAFACQGNIAPTLNAPVKANASPVVEPAREKTDNLPNVQNVTIVSADQLPLAGTLFGSSKAGSAAVLLLHQFGSDRHSYDSFAKRLQAVGFSVLSIDGRGFGESTKTAEGKTIGPSRTNESVRAMNGDVAAAYEFLAKQKNVDPARIAIVGASYGSSLALIYGAENKSVKAVALLSPGLNYFGNMPTEPAVGKFGDRALLMVAAEDDKESADTVRKLKATGANDKYETQIYPKGGHGTGLFAAKVGLEDLLEQFLKKTL